MRNRSLFALVLIFLVMVVRPAQAQEQPELRLRLSRNWGFSSGSGQIQGLFTLKASGPEDLQQVVFYLDGVPLGEADQPPFELRLNTDEHGQGVHTLHAVGQTASGEQLRSNDIRVVFVSAEQGWKSTSRIILPLLVVVFGAMLLSFLLMFLTAGKHQSLPLGTPRKYGISGGAICPKCQRPFALHFFALNLGLGKFDRCPYCGKWSVLRPRPIAELRQAEEVELQAAMDAALPPEVSEEEKLRRELDDSRFQDS